MLGLTLLSQFWIIPRMDTLRASVGDFATVPLDNPARVQFDALHVWSTRVEGAVLLLGLVVVYFTASALQPSLKQRRACSNLRLSRDAGTTLPAASAPRTSRIFSGERIQLEGLLQERGFRPLLFPERAKFSFGVSRHEDDLHIRDARPKGDAPLRNRGYAA